MTDLCNFKCSYCLPNGFQKPTGQTEDELSLREIENALLGFAKAGFNKVRFTGGEPTTRPDLLKIIEAASDLDQFQKLALSTNAWNLRKIASDLKLAGLTHLNVSVDSLNRERFHQLTGRDQLDDVLSGIDRALELQFQNVKINVVLHQGTALSEFEQFLQYVKDRSVSVRFIELMKTKDHGQYQKEHFVSSGVLRLFLLKQGWKPLARSGNDGPALEFMHPEYAGRIGLIAPYSDGFCETCNRLRLTSRGKLRLCLFGGEDFSLRSYFQTKDTAEQLPDKLASLLEVKAESHFLIKGDVGNVQNFSVMGG